MGITAGNALTYNWSADSYGQAFAQQSPFLVFPQHMSQPMQSNTTIRVLNTNGLYKDFDLADADANEAAALEYASEVADATRATVRLVRPFAVVTPERKTTVTKL